MSGLSPLALLAALALAQAEGAPPEAPVVPSPAAETPVPEAPTPPAYTVDELVVLALGHSGLVLEADGKVQEWRGRLAEVQSLYYPKLQGIGYVAPLYDVERSSITGDPFRSVDNDWGSWGPYFHLEAVLAQPLYSFGRISKGVTAARERLAVEQARARQTRNVLALEVRKLYYLHLFTRSIQPALALGRKLLDGAREQARKLFEEGSGKVTQVDLQKLEYGSAELERFTLMATMGEALSLAALKHTVGLPQSAPLVLAEERLPPPPTAPLPPLAVLLRLASEGRPEWAQLVHGKAAALSLEEAERLANAPVVFAAGQLRADWAPHRPDLTNSYFYDQYNQVTGGVALGLLFDLDPWKARARGDAAAGLGTQVEGLRRFAESGIPLEVRKAHDDAVQAQATVAIADRGSVAARKWMTFAAAAYTSGTGEAKDVLEGLAAYVQSRRTYLEALQGLHTALGYVQYAVGGTGVGAPPAGEPR